MKGKTMLFGGELEKILKTFLKFKPIIRGLMPYLNIFFLLWQQLQLNQKKLNMAIGM